MAGASPLADQPPPQNKRQNHGTFEKNAVLSLVERNQIPAEFSQIWTPSKRLAAFGLASGAASSPIKTGCVGLNEEARGLTG